LCSVKPCIHLSPNVFIDKTKSTSSSFVLCGLSVDISEANLVFGVLRNGNFAVRLGGLVSQISKTHSEIGNVFVGVVAIRGQQPSFSISPSFCLDVWFYCSCHILIKLFHFYFIMAYKLHIEVTSLEIKSAPWFIWLRLST